MAVTSLNKEELTSVDPLPSYDDANDENDGGSTNDAEVAASAAVTTTTESELAPKKEQEPEQQQPSATEKPQQPQGQEDDAPPRLPTRPKTQLQINTETLRDAFPGTESKIIRAVLIASGGKLDPAFNGLLSLSDPSFVPPEEDISQDQPSSLAPENSREQVLADERYARKLAEQEERRRTRRREGGGGNTADSSSSLRRESPSEFQTFIESDLPVIKDNLQRGFFETQRKVNTWVANWKKKMDGDPPQSLVDQAYDAFSGGSSNVPQNPVSGNDLYTEDTRSRYRGDGWQTQQPHYGYPRQKSDYTSREKQFSDLSLENNEQPPPKPPRPSAATLAPKGAEGVSAFGTTSSSHLPESTTTQTSNKKWQPLGAATGATTTTSEKQATETSSNIVPTKSNDSSKAGAAGSDKPDPFFVDDSDEEDASK